MRWPWESRQSSYTDALVAAITANAGGQATAFPTATAALETAAGFVGRAFASAEVTAIPAVRAVLTPPVLAMIGRALITRGEIVFYIDVRDGQITLTPAETHDVSGTPAAQDWRYQVTVGGPSGTKTYNRVPVSGVVHLTYGSEPDRPWRGVGPLQAAQLAGRLSAETTAALAAEATTPRGNLVPIPVDGADPTVAQLKGDLASRSFAMHLLEGGDWGARGEGRADWVPRRLGANPPEELVTLQQNAHDQVLGACGLSPALFDVRAAGTSIREAYRQALHSTVAPLGSLVAAELTAKLETDVALGWAELRAADIAGRARAYQSLTNAGMEPERAAQLAGLDRPA